MNRNTWAFIGDLAVLIVLGAIGYFLILVVAA